MATGTLPRTKLKQILPDAQYDSMKRACLICGREGFEVVFVEFGIEILRCQRCGHAFSTYPAETDYTGYWGKSVEESQVRPWWDQAHRKPFAAFRKRFLTGRSGRLLDVGCGLGYFVKAVSESPGWEAWGYEISPTAVEFARHELGLLNVFCGRVEESQLYPTSFDIITLWDVLEHIPGPDPLLAYLHSLLKADGLLFIHTPNIKAQLPKARLKKLMRGMDGQVQYLEARDHVNIYSMKNLQALLLRNSFGRVEFIHLPPIQSVSGNNSWPLIALKNLWYLFSLALFNASGSKINLDNLFAVARKSRET